MEIQLERYANEVHSRRAVLSRGLGALALGAVSRGRLAFASSDRVSSEPACALTPEQTIGPYYIDRKVVRYDLTEGKPGVPLKLRIALVDVKRCASVNGAALDIWHCDAMGVYSGFTANSPDGPPGGGPPFDPSQRSGRPPGPPPGGPPEGFGPPPGGPGFGGGPPGGRGSRKIDDTNFLRGVQLTDKQGMVEFATIYPGWYVGRDIHIHLRVHIGGLIDGAKYRGGHVSHTGQLFFSDDLTDHIARIDPYAAHHTLRTRLEEDNVYAGDHGGPMLSITPMKQGSLENGLVATVTLGIDPDAIPKEHGFGPGGRPPGA